MPQIKIKETDLTTVTVGEYKNFAVVVPGVVVNNEEFAGVCDENNVYECNSQLDFVTYVGIPETTGDETQIGNQIAYELLGLGYPVLYKKYDPENDDLGDAEYWDSLKDKATYDFRFIINGLLTDNVDANTQITVVATHHDDDRAEINNGRGDCTALCDIDESIYNTVANRASRVALFNAIKPEALALGKYAAWFAPSVCLKGTSSKYVNHKFPASFYYLACFKNALDNGFAEWYAAAGYTRGVCKYIVESTDVNFGEYLINALEPRTNESGLLAAVNVIAKIRKNYYLWGNRTAAALGGVDLKAEHFLNIRQLCSTLKKQIYVACRKFTFDPNSDVLWINFCNALKPTLEGMKADQGVKDYKIVKLRTSKKAELKARVRIIPIEAVEDFDIEITLEDNFGETSANVSEVEAVEE